MIRYGNFWAVAIGRDNLQSVNISDDTSRAFAINDDQIRRSFSIDSDYYVNN